MEAHAINRYIGTSPRKMRLVIDLIRGKSVPEALHILHFSPKHAARVAEKVLRSAVANLQNKDEAGRLEPEEIVVRRASVDGGMTMKRISPAPMGRAYRIRKRSNHVMIVVAAREAAPSKKAAPKPKPTPKAEAKTAPKAPPKQGAVPAKDTAPTKAKKATT
ncbi:MAG TPA: 50S ribosomal protein L22 [Bacteroidota bacterium]|nr:50S ribosomal protein L22 [Bacteroidota bacterium]